MPIQSRYRDIGALTGRLRHRNAPILHQPHCLKLELATELPSSHPPLSSSVKHLISAPTKPAAGQTSLSETAPIIDTTLLLPLTKGGMSDQLNGCFTYLRR